MKKIVLTASLLALMLGLTVTANASNNPNEKSSNAQGPKQEIVTPANNGRGTSADTPKGLSKDEEIKMNENSQDHKDKGNADKNDNTYTSADDLKSQSNKKDTEKDGTPDKKVEEQNKETSVQTDTAANPTIDDLKAQLKEKNIDKGERKALLKQIVDMRKKNGDNSTAVVANGKFVNFDVPPVIKEGRMLIPVRAVTNALGAEVTWVPETPNIVTITKSIKDANGTETTTIIIMDLKTGKVTVNGVEAQLDVPPQLINNRTVVPLRFIAETFGLKVDYDKDTGGVFVDDEDEDTQTPGDQTTTPATDPASGTTTEPTTGTDTTPVTDPASGTTTEPTTGTDTTPVTDPASGTTTEPTTGTDTTPVTDPASGTTTEPTTGTDAAPVTSPASDATAVPTTGTDAAPVTDTTATATEPASAQTAQ